jgi:hypothetical protein
MELLLDTFRSQIAHIVPRTLPARKVYLCPAATIRELPRKITARPRGFVLLLVLDAESLKDQEIEYVADKLLNMGLAYLCAWGPDCERVHDLFDAEAESTNEKLTGDDVVMTTWHSEETLAQALWFFLHAAFPTQCFEADCADWVIAPIGNSAWEEEIRNKIRKIASKHTPE